MASITEVNAKGDLIVGSGDNETLIVPVGLPDQVLTADPTTRAGVSWQNAAGGSSGVQAVATSGLKFVAFTGDTSSGWALAPSDYYAPIPAAVGDVLLFDPSMLVTVGADAELDVVSVIGGAPSRYYSTGTTVAGPNGHGGLYIGTGFNRSLKSIRWIVAAEDIDESGNVTLSLLRRNGAGVTFGNGTYPGQVNVTNLGGVL